MGNTIIKDSVRREFEDLKRDLNEGSIPKVAAEYKEHLNKMNNLPLNIAVTGHSGSGKSSFVNAFRGVNDDDDGAAKVGTVEGTMKPKAYSHPSFPNMKLWDLPGIGTPKFQATEYLKKVQFEKYDLFIIVISIRLTENDAFLAKEIKRMGRKFYFVCSKMDANMQVEKRKGNFNMQKTLETIRNYYENSLRSAGDFSARVFLISSWEVHMYDFPLLRETMAAELPEHKKNILTLAVHIFSKKELMKKKELMESYIKKVAWVSCVCGAVPVPGLSMACDIVILVDTLKYFCKVFGLDDQSLHFLAAQTGKAFKELKSAIKKTPLGNVIDAELVFSLLTRSSIWVAVSLVELALDFIPIIGSVFGGASSYVITYRFLNSFLDDALEDAQNVLAKFLQ
ncbi:interferon-inducible GTPase 5-like [Protobothrops mucrosquamatus]|uniref:interferon-inducible GTPase 5-like n=1 Tax=Protobothrops mucrosquamatus TaxID=103944 RepID=UPI000775C3AD|nr:interferon-inducible GTPase 5-like [Protobothrops mucrosquamatus]